MPAACSWVPIASTTLHSDMGLLESLKDANAAALRLNSAPKVQEPMAPRSVCLPSMVSSVPH